MKDILALSAFLLVLAYCRGIQDIEIKKQEILDALLKPEKYDKRVRPIGSGESITEVKIDAYIIDIPDMDDDLKEYTMQAYFRQHWVDERLKFTKEAEKEKIRKIRCVEPEKVWQPDLFFINEVGGKMHDLVVPNEFMHLTPEGGIVYSVRVSVIFTCDSDMKYYPHDQQKCIVNLESYGYNAEELRLRWNTDMISGNAIKFSDKLSSRFKFQLLDHEERLFKVTFNETSYERLSLEILFSRNFSYFFQTIYIPSILLIILSWGSFCLDSKQFIPRVSFLGLIIFFMLCLAPEPRNNLLQITAMEVWEGACMTFLLAAFVVLIVVNQMTKREEAEHAASEQSEVRDAESGNMKEEKPNDVDGKKAESNKFIQKFMKEYPTRSRKTDAICRIVFPILFLLFNIIYWPVCYSNYKATVEEWNDADMK